MRIIIEMEKSPKTRQATQQRENDYVTALRKVPDFNSLVTCIDAGAFNDLASVIRSQMTVDFRTEHDERLAEGKLMAFNARIMARWFATIHDDTIAKWKNDDHNVDNPDRDADYHTVDEARMELFKKLWMLFEEVTMKIHSTNSEEDRIAQKCIGNNLDITLHTFCCKQSIVDITARDAMESLRRIREA